MENAILIEARTKAGLTQVQIAEKARISHNSYQRCERGLRDPQAKVANRIAQILHTTSERLFSMQLFIGWRRSGGIIGPPHEVVQGHIKEVGDSFGDIQVGATSADLVIAIGALSNAEFFSYNTLFEFVGFVIAIEALSSAEFFSYSTLFEFVGFPKPGQTTGKKARAVMNQLKATRTEHGLTQEELAQAAGMTVRSYRDYERGQCPRSVTSAIKIAKRLNTTVEKRFSTKIPRTTPNG